MTRNPSTLAPSSTPLDRSLPDWQAEPWSATALHWAARLTPWKSMFVLGFVGMGVWLMDPSTAVTVEEAPAPPTAAVASPPNAKPVAVRVVVPPPAPKTADAAVPGPASAPPPISALPPSAAFDPFVTELQKPDAMFPDRIKTRLVRRVVLDPGHGGDNEGTVGVIGVREKVLMLQLAWRIAAYLQAHSDLEVVLTRTGDETLPLRERPRLANQWHADVLISLHANAHEKTDVEGMEVFFLSAASRAESSRRAIEQAEGIEEGAGSESVPWSVGAIVDELDQASAHERSQDFAELLAASLRSVRPSAAFRGVRQAAFGVLKEAKMPAVVLEVGYLSHAREGRTLVEDRVHREFAQAVLKSLQRLDAQMAAALLSQPLVVTVDVP